ncbi:hypothetical protein C5Y96_20980 [Blastopirellula marina]|uniref:DUF11 domain-containing protein n=1 Tax=Blastopirellula marina TaxID=124 RepID=A0A2S8F188_9BACT|nr:MULTISPECIES: DUF11 domain-containing protein [Pirellulaceae]PQO25931.1 hypothetical protein C5Y96_20980 [Blastopirellula marina]RCS44289.1 DUF11 domain-containing protein [Bremerella cremea]
MMHRSAILGTAGLIVLAALGHVVISGLMPQQEVSAETKSSVVHEFAPAAPSRFTAPESSVPLQPMPARMNSKAANGMRLTAGEESTKPSSRRRVATTELEEPAKTEDAPEVTPPAGLPSSLDEALSRFRDNPVSLGNEPEAAPELEAPAPQEPPKQEASPMPKPAAPSQPNPYRYQPAPTEAEAPAANGAASIGAPQPAAPETPKPQVKLDAEPQPAMPQPTSIPRQTLSAVETPAPAPQPTTTSATLFSVNSPAVVVDTTGPKSLVIGKPSTYRIHARNMGDASARQVTIQMVLPQGIQLQDLRGTLGSPRQVQTPTGMMAVQWDIPVLPAHSEGSLDLGLVATQTRPFELGMEVMYAPMSAKSPISVLEPKLDMVIDGPQDILFGDSQIFKVIAKNTGTGPAENVSITIMPIKKGQNPTVIDSIGTIAPGDQKVIELELTAKQAGTLALRAETSADNGLRAAAAHDVLVRRAELAVNAQGPGIKYAATTATYAVVVANAGNAPASSIQVEAQLPTGSKFVSASHGGKLDEASGRVTWNLPKLEAGTQQPLQVVSTLMVEGNNILQISANADQGLSSRHEMITRVESVADLKLLVNDPTGPIPVGQEVEYEFTLNNRGTKEARGVKVTVSFGSGIEPVLVEGGKGTIQGDIVQLNTIPTVNAGQEITVKVKARGRSEGNHTFRAEVRCDDPTTRLAIEESTHFYGATLQTASPQMPAPRYQPQPPAAQDPAAGTPAPLSPTPFSRYQ